MGKRQPFDPYKFVGGSKRMSARKGAQFINAIQYVGGIMSVVLVEEYGWSVEQVRELVKKMGERVQKEEINGL